MGKLNCLTITRLDITYCFSSKYSKSIYEISKNLSPRCNHTHPRNLKKAFLRKILYKCHGHCKREAFFFFFFFFNANWARSLIDHRPTQSIVFVRENLVSWTGKKQLVISLWSTCFQLSSYSTCYFWICVDFLSSSLTWDWVL